MLVTKDDINFMIESLHELMNNGIATEQDKLNHYMFVGLLEYMRLEQINEIEFHS